MGGYILLNGFYRLVAVNDYYLPAAYVVAGLANLEEKIFSCKDCSLVLCFYKFLPVSLVGDSCPDCGCFMV